MVVAIDGQETTEDLTPESSDAEVREMRYAGGPICLIPPSLQICMLPIVLDWVVDEFRMNPLAVFMDWRMCFYTSRLKGNRGEGGREALLSVDTT